MGGRLCSVSISHTPAGSVSQESPFANHLLRIITLRTAWKAAFMSWWLNPTRPSPSTVLQLRFQIKVWAGLALPEGHCSMWS